MNNPQQQNNFQSQQKHQLIRWAIVANAAAVALIAFPPILIPHPITGCLSGFLAMVVRISDDCAMQRLKKELEEKQNSEQK